MPAGQISAILKDELLRSGMGTHWFKDNAGTLKPLLNLIAQCPY